MKSDAEEKSVISQGMGRGGSEVNGPHLSSLPL